MRKDIIWAGSFIRGVRITYHDAAGKQRCWEAVERSNCDGVVAIVPITRDGKAVLIRQFRPAVNGYVIEFPAGLNDRNEDKEAAARREFIEETGYAAAELLFLARGPLSSGLSGEILDVFLAKGLTFVGIGQRDETEDIEVLEIPIDRVNEELMRLSARDNLIDLKIQESYIQSFLKLGYRVIYIGNGDSDVAPAKSAHHVFATGDLLAYSKENNLNCKPFKDFRDVVKDLEQISQSYSEAIPFMLIDSPMRSPGSQGMRH